jgi:hypothetical protein
MDERILEAADRNAKVRFRSRRKLDNQHKPLKTKACIWNLEARAGGVQLRIFNDLHWITARRRPMRSQALTDLGG